MYTYSRDVHTFVYEYHLDDRVVRNVDLVRAHTIGAAISRSVITVTKLFRWDVIDLRERRRRRERERDLVHKRNHVVTGRRNCERIELVPSFISLLLNQYYMN